MKCLKPFYAFIPWENIRDEVDYNILWRRPGEPEPDSHTKLTIPCRKCMPCRIKHAGQWVVRLLHEALLHNEPSLFVTLTYDDDNLPEDGSLKHRHFQLFMMRVRKAFPGKKIRYFMCGEYGEHTYRAHYHAILFGLPLEDLKYFRHNRNGDKLYTSKTLTDLWKLGHVTIGYANKSTMAYTAGYLLKNQVGLEYDEADKPIVVNQATGEIVHGPNIELQLARPYIRMSTAPGIGAGFVDRYAQDLQKDYFTIDGKRYGLPKYYTRRLKKENPRIYDYIMEAREERNQEEAETIIRWETKHEGTFEEELERRAHKSERIREHSKSFFKPVKEKKL